jgi:heme exporter protein CcmD
MIVGGWMFVIAAYALTFGALVALIVRVALSARRWSREAEKLDKP